MFLTDCQYDNNKNSQALHSAVSKVCVCRFTGADLQSDDASAGYLRGLLCVEGLRVLSTRWTDSPRGETGGILHRLFVLYSLSMKSCRHSVCHG